MPRDTVTFHPASVFDGNVFAGSATLVEVCALLSAVLILHVLINEELR